MTVEHTRTGFEAHKAPTTAELIERLSRFEGPPELFLANLLAVQCHIASAEAGAILRVAPEGKAEVLAVHPALAQGSTAPMWLAQAAASVARTMETAQTVTQPVHEPDELYGQPARRHLVMIPLARSGGIGGAAAFILEAGTRGELAAGQDRLELSTSLLSLYEMRLALQRRGADLRRMRVSLEALSAVNGSDRFAAAAMAMCNEVASRWQCDCVSLGFLAGRYVKLKAMSHTEKLSRKMKLVQTIEAAMEECLDQDLEVLYPPASQAAYISRATGELATRHGPAAVASVPLRREAKVVAVLTAQRPAENVFTTEEMESLRLTCDLCTPRLVDLHEHDRWVGARAAASAREALAAGLGPKHTWLKLAAVLAMVVLAALIFGKGEYRADAPFALEATLQQRLPAPFDGYLMQVYVDPGDNVVGSKADEPSWLLEAADVQDWAGLLAEIRAQAAAGEPSAGKHIWALLGEEARQAIAAAEGAEPNDQAKAAIIRQLNDLLRSEACYDSAAWQGFKLGQRQTELLADLKKGTPKGGHLVELNRSLLATAFPQRIAAGPTVLATLDTAELRLQLAAAQADRTGRLTEAAAAMRDGKTAQAQIAQAAAEEVAARIRLLEYQIEKARIVSKISGLVVTGDLRRQVGAPVKMGDVLFEVAPVDRLRAELAVPDNQIADVQLAVAEAVEKDTKVVGELATAAYPEQRIPFQVERVNPMAEVVDQQNVFKVRAHLGETYPWMRPGMEGVAKISLGRRSYGWLLTHKVVNWARMKLWL
ncbi:MAG: hypothetical protein AMJ81_01995 [Phycisphaerae bacterium SM23_33]|nr:MAG: hypothetical protein AMJ81_01995 [Phycisphaerae bacterium SM23_33]